MSDRHADGGDFVDPNGSNDGVIAVFDSGFGGLNILEALRDLLPHESFVYLGDSARSPYGDRQPSEVIRYSREILGYLQSHYRVKLVVVACNTASALALDVLQSSSDVPIIGVIDAAIRAIGQVTRNSRVGVVGTTATIRSGVYQRQLAHESVTAQACPGLVEYVEAGEVDADALVELMRRHLEPLRQAQVDTLLLACTHYPYLATQFRRILGEGVTLISSGEETAFEVRKLLDESACMRAPHPSGPPAVEFLCTGAVDDFIRIGGRLFSDDFVSVRQVNVARWDQVLSATCSMPYDRQIPMSGTRPCESKSEQEIVHDAAS